MTRDQWLQRCAARFKEVADFNDATAMAFAEVQLESLNHDISGRPEDAADDEMSYWTED